MSRIPKEIRKRVWTKYDGHCAYCGKDILYNKMHVDHIEPRWHNLNEEHADRLGLTKGTDDEENLNPSCARCNRWKETKDIETFRDEIRKLYMKLQRDSPQYRMALDYGMIKENKEPIKFYYEKN